MKNCSGVHYYWNTVDDTVSWLPPDHPDANIAKSAAVLRKELEALQTDADEKDGVQEDATADVSCESIRAEVLNLTSFFRVIL